MIKLFSASLVIEDTSSIVDKLTGYGYSACDWTSLKNLVHHILFAFDFSILINSVDFSSLLSPTAFLWETVLALNHSRTSNTIVVSKSLIWWTSLISNVIIMDPFISSFSVTTVASFIWFFTRNQNLWTKNDIWPLSFSSDFNTIT